MMTYLICHSFDHLNDHVHHLKLELDLQSKIKWSITLLTNNILKHNENWEIIFVLICA